MSKVILTDQTLHEIEVKDTKHIGSEGAEIGTAILPDKREIPVYRHPEYGNIWYEQEGERSDWYTISID